MTMRVPITKPFFDEADMAALRGPLETGWVVQGPNVADFEAKFAAFAGTDEAVACTSCTTGLQLSLAALGIGPGDEVVVPSFTWVASANVVAHMGGTPVLCDIDLDTFNVDPASMASKITPRTKALLPVHVFGLSADMEAVLDLAQAHDLAVVEDAACGLGARWRGQHVGTIGDFGAFSFHPRKAVTTGEGGMILASDSSRIKLLRTLRDHGSAKSDRARHMGKAAFLLSTFDHLGYNYRMTDIQGALGSSQMDKAQWVLEQRIARARRYDELLADVSWLQTPKVPADCDHAYQAYVCLFVPEAPSVARLDVLNARRNALLTATEERGVSTRQGTHAVHGLGYYRETYGYTPLDCPQSLLAEGLSITLPLYPQMTDAEQDYVVEVLLACYAEL